MNYDMGFKSSIKSIFIVSVAIIYFTLIPNICDKLLDCESIYDMCDDINPVSHDNIKEYDECRKKKSELENKFDKKKLNCILIVGSLSLLAGVFISSKQFDKYNLQTPSVGISFGSLLMLVYYITKNWYDINNNTRIGILSISLAILVYGSSRI